MSEHFRAFSFVDRILSDETGTRITGEYQIPAGIDEFPQSLVAEAIGQLAAWSSMKAIDFKCRPVAGIAGAVDLISPVRPGQTLSLEADLAEASEESVKYGGLATVDGEPIVQLHDCLGPMVDMEQFDDPAAMAARYDLLINSGAEAGAYEGVPALSYEITGGQNGETKEGAFTIPEQAPFFGDHFPRNPVFPGTLLMNLNLRFALELASEISGESGVWKAERMSDVKIRSFMAPGTELGMMARVDEVDETSARILVETRRGKRLTSAARVRLSRKK